MVERVIERVIDASIAIKWVVKGEPFRDKARQLLYDARSQHIALIGPPLLEYEVESVLQRRLHSGLASISAVNASRDAFYAVGVRIVSEPGMVLHARDIARKYEQASVYDSIDAALAELRGCEFWTADRMFYETVKTGLSFVKYLPQYA